MPHYSPHFPDLLTLIHEEALLVYHIVVAVAAAENALEISCEGTAVVVQHHHQQQHLLFQVPSLIGNQCNSSTAAGMKDSEEGNKLSRVDVYNHAAAVVNIEQHLDLDTCCHIEVFDSIDNANADYDDPVAAVDDVFDKTEQRRRNLNSLQQ
jgi:hypothetical protein